MYTDTSYIYSIHHPFPKKINISQPGGFCFLPFFPSVFPKKPRHGPSLALALGAGHQQFPASAVASAGPAAGRALQLGEAQPTPGADLRAGAGGKAGENWKHLGSEEID